MNFSRYRADWIRWRRQTGDVAWIRERERAAILPDVIDMHRTRAVIGIEDVGQTIWTNRHIKEVEQRPIRGTECSTVTDRAGVDDVIASLTDRKYRFAAVCVQRLGKHHFPSRSRRHVIRSTRQHAR